MDTGFIQSFLDSLRQDLPTALAVLGIIVGGWLLALIGRGLTRSLLTRIELDRRLTRVFGEGEEAPEINLTSWISRIVYYLILLLVVVTLLARLELGAAAAPISALLARILAFIPLLLGAAALLLVAWIVASALRFVITRGLRAARIDDWLTREAEVEMPGATSVSATLGSVVYWLVFLLFLPAVLEALDIRLEAVQGMVDEILGALPNILGAAIILVVGWIAARIVRQIVTNLLAGAGVDRLGERTGMAAALGEQKLSGILGTVVYVLILIPVVIAGLNSLEIEAVSGPASEMLGSVLQAVPAIFAAFLLIGVAYFVARVVGTFVTNVLTGVGFNRVLTWIGLGSEMVEEGEEEGQTPSQVVGYLTTLAIMLFAVIEAAELLGFSVLADLVSQFLVAAGGVITGIVIFGLGLYLARIAERVIRGTGGSQAHLLAPVARVSIIVFSGALALRQTGIAEDIVNLAFGIVLGTVAVAAALAFGLGAREVAAKEVDRWLNAMRKEPAPSSGGKKAGPPKG
jgi:hypothetical protein